nr:MAG TPA: hypothetical protein [Caudoviricetes sp.]
MYLSAELRIIAYNFIVWHKCGAIFWVCTTD